jgi:hypothetical protein
VKESGENADANSNHGAEAVAASMRRASVALTKKRTTIALCKSQCPKAFSKRLLPLVMKRSA